jgi:ribonucleotide reductase beta subunit family protein with ferritin-like domain
MLKDPRLNFRPLDYPKALEFATQQANHFWTADQIEVDSDLLQYNTEFTEPERHGIQTVLKLFTTYEIYVANYWIDIVYKYFPKHEVRFMASTYASIEAQHGLFYDKMNNGLGLSTKEFYLSFLDDPDMKKRMDFIQQQLDLAHTGKNEDLAVSLATFSFIEGVVLYSSFAFLMSFQNAPKDKLKNTFTGLSYSVRDENLHAEADSWLFNTFIKEYDIPLKDLEPKIVKIAKECLKVEEKIIDNIFSKGKIEGITDVQLANFVKSRINKKLKDISIDPIYEITYNPISSWFYKKINQIEMSDFFDRNPTAYTANWNFGKVRGW